MPPQTNRPERCPVHGDKTRGAAICGACRTEWLLTGAWPPGTRHQDAVHGIPTDDARTRAAGDHP